ncbi:MAG: AraC family transcriptional regulator ligand-binding domain-containing protein [Pseudomonadota bacterium]
MSEPFDQRLERVTISPQILYHTLQELLDRKLDLSRDRSWNALRADIASDRRPRLTFRQSQALIVQALSLSRDPDLGLAVGQRQSFASFGLLSAAMLASGSLREALEIGMRYHRVIGSMLDFEIVPFDDDHVAMVIRSRFAGSPIRRFLMQEALMLIVKSTLFLAPHQNPIIEICTPFRPADRKILEDQCPCAVKYVGDTQQILFRSERLLARLETADQFALAETQIILDLLLRQELAEVDILQSVETRILRSFPHVEKLSEVSAALGCSERSLRRQLSNCGTSYRELLNRLRIERARQRLVEGSLSRDQIAFDLGFSDVRSLRRLLNS